VSDLLALEGLCINQSLTVNHRMVDALVLLLEKSSKSKRTSTAQNVSFPNLTVLLPILVCGLFY
jgi:hypothetical protein